CAGLHGFPAREDGIVASCGSLAGGRSQAVTALCGIWGTGRSARRRYRSEYSTLPQPGLLLTTWDCRPYRRIRIRLHHDFGLDPSVRREDLLMAVSLAYVGPYLGRWRNQADAESQGAFQRNWCYGVLASYR